MNIWPFMVMKEYLIYVESDPEFISYLSPAIQYEFIHLIEFTTRQSLLRGIRKDGLMFDSTPMTMSSCLQLWYVDVDFEKKEVCIGF